jgi:uncharacterized LabA/DUF88 family protein
MNSGVIRVGAYVDGFNLYFGLKEAALKRLYWLDVQVLAANLLKPGQSVTATHYFTSRIRDNGRNAADRKRQATYIDALQVQGVSIHEGHYLPKDRTCLRCSNTWREYEEKETDVNIAVQMLTDAFDDLYDMALVLSGDSDLSTPVRRVRARFPQKRIVVAFPPKRHSSELKRLANGYLSIGEDKLRASQLPATVTTPTGYVLRRPVQWH